MRGIILTSLFLTFRELATGGLFGKNSRKLRNLEKSSFTEHLQTSAYI